MNARKVVEACRELNRYVTKKQFHKSNRIDIKRNSSNKQIYHQALYINNVYDEEVVL